MVIALGIRLTFGTLRGGRTTTEAARTKWISPTTSIASG